MSSSYPDCADVDQVLTLSTAHITEKDAEILSEACIDPLGNVKREIGGDLSVYRKGPYGFIIYVDVASGRWPGVNAALRRAGLSEAFVEVVLTAIHRDCEWMMLDRDGPVYDFLDQFDW